MIIALNHIIAREKGAAARFFAATLGLDYNASPSPCLRPVWANAGQEDRATVRGVTSTDRHRLNGSCRGIRAAGAIYGIHNQKKISS